LTWRHECRHEAEAQSLISRPPAPATTTLPEDAMQAPIARRRIHAAALATLCIAFATAAHARVADSPALRPLATLKASPSADAGSSPWWTPFHEDALAELQQAARAHAGHGADRTAAGQPRLDMRVASAYVTARTLTVRASLATDLSDTLQQQHDRLAAQPSTPALAAALAQVDARRDEAQRFASGLLAQRDAAIAQLAQWCGRPVDALRSELEPALIASAIPVFDAQSPQRLPRTVLAARADVGAVDSRALLWRKQSPGAGFDLVRRAQVLGGWIDAQPAAQASAPATAGTPAIDELATVASRAEEEIRGRMRELQARSEGVHRLYEVVRARQVELGAVQRRHELGAGSDDEVLVAYQRLLLDNDQLAIAGGALADAWIRLQQSTGGQALAAAPKAED
jgi:hypothetical protein